MLKLPNLQRDVRLAPYTTYQIGGPADYFVEVHNEPELMAAILAARAAHMPYFLLGTGANILVTDRGFRGLVIRNRADRSVVHGHSLTAESGATIAELIELAAAYGLSGLEHYTLIPSSVGGAMWQNLHFASVDAPHWQTTGELRSDRTLYIAEVVRRAKVLTAAGEIKIVDRDFFEFDYDYSILHRQPLVVLEVTFGLKPRPKPAIELQMQANATWRRAKQPQLPEWPSCGSIFKKIEGVGAGRLIDQAGLKGRRIGGAQISEQHANYILNLGDATAADVLALIELVQREVKAATGYELHPEIGVVGER
ncbi:MAG TPA: FAD-binding protein [Candidatus Saccharimonadia bacterium]|nr:FAD-binding protein [Candidatus Saccharimonadia bacterium]